MKKKTSKRIIASLISCSVLLTPMLNVVATDTNVSIKNVAEMTDSNVKSVSANGVDSISEGSEKINTEINNSEKTSLLTKSNSITFFDVEDHWAKEYIYFGVEKGYINGYSDGTFLPDKTVTRAEFSKMLNYALGIKALNEIDFIDVDSNMWFYNEVRKAYGAGYIFGYENNTFMPNNNITRQEAAVIMSRVLPNTSKSANLIAIADREDISEWAYDSVYKIFAKGYMTGNNLNKYEPQGLLTRGQAAKIIGEMKKNEVIISDDKTIKTAQSFKDTVFAGNVVISDNLKSGKVSFDNCKFLGLIAVESSNAEEILFNNCEIKSIDIASEKGTVDVTVSGKTKIDKTNVSSAATLTEKVLSGEGFCNITLDGSSLSGSTVALKGEFNVIDVNSSVVLQAENSKIDKLSVNKKIALIVQSGKISTLNISTDSKGSSVVLASPVTVDFAKINAQTDFTGAGKIKEANQVVSEITYETQPDKITGKTNSDGEIYDSLKPTFTPENGQTSVSTTSSINLSFDEAVYKIGGGTITAGYLQNTVFELRRGSLTGASVDFTATISSSKKYITISPRTDLDYSTKYYIVVLKGTLQNKDALVNPKAYSYFITDSAKYMSPTITPSEGNTGVSIDTNIKVTFPSTVYRDDSRSSVTASYIINNAIQIRKGSSSGPLIDYTVSISSNRIFTLTPDEPLIRGTKYYIIVLKDSLYNSSSQAVQKTTSYFTTSNEVVPLVTPYNATTNVSISPSIEFKFDEVMYRSNGSVLTSSYLETYAIELRKSSPSSGTVIDFNATISSDKKTITILPVEPLSYSTKYYITLLSGSLETSNNVSNNKYSSYFTTGAVMTPAINPANGKIDVGISDEITVAFGEQVFKNDTASSELTSEYIKSDVIELRRNSTTGVKIPFICSISNDKRTITLRPENGFEPDVKYYVILISGKLKNTAGKTNSKINSSFTTSGKLIPTITPRNSDTGIATDSKIIITFDEAMYNDNKGTLTAGHIEDLVVEMRKGSEDGENVLFTASVSSSRKIITLTPTEILQGFTKYYIIINPETLSNYAENLNPRYISAFTTSEATNYDVIFSPQGGQSGVSINSDISINFGSDLSKYNGGTPTATYLSSSAFELRKASSTGTKVDVIAKMSADRRTVTLAPKVPLEKNTTYFLKLLPRTLQFNSANIISAKTISFSTSDGKPIIKSVKVISTGATNAELRVISDTTGTVTVDIRDGSNFTKSYTAEVVENEETTIIFDSLKADTSYTVSASIRSVSGAVSDKGTSAFKTLPIIELSTKATDSNSTILNVAYLDGGILDVKYVKVSTQEETTQLTGQTLTGKGNKEINLTGLSENSEYACTVSYAYGENVFTSKIAFKTEKATDYLTLNKLLIKSGTDVYTVDLSNSELVAYIAYTTSVKISPTTEYANKVTIKVKSSTVESGTDSPTITVAEGTENVVEIVVTSKETGNSKTYVLKINVNSKA